MSSTRKATFGSNLLFLWLRAVVISGTSMEKESLLILGSLAHSLAEPLSTTFCKGVTVVTTPFAERHVFLRKPAKREDFLLAAESDQIWKEAVLNVS